MTRALASVAGTLASLGAMAFLVPACSSTDDALAVGPTGPGGSGASGAGAGSTTNGSGGGPAATSGTTTVAGTGGGTSTGGTSGAGGNSGGGVTDASPGDSTDGSVVRDTSTPGNDAALDTRPTGDGPVGERFSFFVTSLVAMRTLSNNQNGFGGDLRFGKATGLEGADEICRQTAERSMPGNGKTWRAFLSVAVGPGGGPVNAIDRIGSGPWYDRRGRLFAQSKANLATGALRPAGADPTIINDLPNEEGVPNHNPDGTVADNHHFMTGSTATGTLHTTGSIGTCQDWTTAVGTAGQPRCGFAWPRMIGQTQPNGAHWISGIDEAGCGPTVFITGTGGAPPGATGVGSGGGYGGIYCFALTP